MVDIPRPQLVTTEVTARLLPTGLRVSSTLRHLLSCRRLGAPRLGPRRRGPSIASNHRVCPPDGWTAPGNLGRGSPLRSGARGTPKTPALTEVVRAQSALEVDGIGIGPASSYLERPARVSNLATGPNSFPTKPLSAPVRPPLAQSAHLFLARKSLRCECYRLHGSDPCGRHRTVALLCERGLAVICTTPKTVLT